MGAKKRIITDVHEPNAGTDYHILWAIRKCLLLINFEKDGLKSVAMEGIDPEDAREVDPDGGKLLAVDLTEYYGSTDFSSAKKVVISQLKYSTRHPEQEWTPFSVSQGKKGTTGSIIHRLATTFQGFVDKFGADTVLSKTIIQLVSNRPAQPLLQQLADAAKQLHIISPRNATIASLKKQFPKNQRAIEKMVTASMLGSKLFIQFLSILDFSDCRSDSRTELRTKALQSIADLGSIDAEQQLATLESLVFSKAQPDTKYRNRIRVTDILARFKASQLADLFPVQPEFENLKTTIPRTQYEDLSKTILSSSGKGPICIHGEGGIGKSTFARQVPHMLPPNSECILFDCYGSGAYLNTGDDRHLHRYAFLQLCNELALKTNSPFLLERRVDDTEFVHQFSRRLEYAASEINKRSKDALLVIIIDAADNSVTAANETGEKCFVHDLVGLPVPANVRLIFTFRSHQKPTLKLPENLVDFTIHPFDESETGAFLASRFRGHTFTTKQVEEFRKLTRSVPRVMSFVLATKGSNLAQKLRPLRPGGKDLNAVFKMVIDQARRKSGNRSMFNKVLHHAILLPRPMPVKYLAETTGAEKPFVRDCINDLGIAIIISHDHLGFNNEDFERYIRDEFEGKHADIDKIANYFKNNAEREEYASLYLGRFLAKAGRHKELEEIVLSRSLSKLPEDPVRNREMFIERAMLAMRNTLTNGDRVTYLQLQIVAAEASKENTVLQDLMIQNPELANTFGNNQTNQKFYFQDNKRYWSGRIHLRSAALFSRNRQTIQQAKKHLESASDWISFRNDLAEEERRKYELNDIDLACGTEAILHISGAAKAAKWLKGWKPKEILYQSLDILLTNLIQYSTPAQIKKWCHHVHLRFDVKLQINQRCFQSGLPVPFSINELVIYIPRLKSLRSKIEYPLWSALVSLAEQLCRTNYSNRKMIELLEFFQTTTPENRPVFYRSKYQHDDEHSHIDVFFRIIALKKLFGQSTATPEDLLPERLKIKPQEEKNIEDKEKKAENYERQQYLDQERRNFLAYYKHLLPCYELLAIAYRKKKDDSVIIDKLNLVLTAYENDYELSYYHRFDSIHLTRFLAVKLIDLVFLVNKPSLIVDSIVGKLKSKGDDHNDLLLSIAENLSITTKLHRDILQILQQVDKKIVESTFPSSTQIELYVRASVVGNRVSASTGKLYFDKVIAAAKDIDQEAFEQIKAVYQVVKRSSQWNDAELAFDFGRYVEFCSVKLKGYEDFPWEAAISAIGRIDALSVLALSCRWDHRNSRRAYKDFPELLIPGIETGVIPAPVAGALLLLNKYYWEDYLKTVKITASSIALMSDQLMKNRFLTSLTHDLTMHFQYPRQHETMVKIIAVLEEAGFKHNQILIDFKQHCSKIEQIFRPKDDKMDGLYRSAYDVDSQEVYIDLKGIDITDLASVESLLLEHKRKGAEENAFDYKVGKCLDAMFIVAQPCQYVKHLDVLISISTSLVDFWTFDNAFKKRIEEWDIYPDVKTWKQTHFGDIIRNRFFHYIRFDSYYDEGAIFRMAKLCEVSDEVFAQVVVDSLPQHVTELSAQSLIRLLEITTLGIIPQKKFQFLRWLITRWSGSIKTNFGDGTYQPMFAPNSDNHISIALYIRYQLGHPDKRNRWRGAKTVVQLGKESNQEVFKTLLAIQNNITNFPFQDKDAHFYWIAAKLWLWLAIHKLSIEQPSSILPYAKEMFAELSVDKIQHLQILFFIKESCLALERSFQGTYEQEEIKTLTQLLVSPVRSEAHSNRKNKYEGSEHKTRFQFNSIDTIEYWFDPLGQRFHLSGYEIAKMADEVICDQWGYSGDPRNDNFATSDEDGLMSHYKHDIPTIDSLLTYLEYNAMQCVAAKLIHNYPIVEGDSYFTSWQDWFDDQSLLWKDIWLSDLKDPIPSEAMFWLDRASDDHWRYNVQKERFDEIASFNNHYRPGYLVVHGGVDIYYGKDHERQDVASALIESKYAEAALRAFQTMDSSDVYFPLEKDEDREYEPMVNDESSITHHFEPVPWLQSISMDRHGLDEFDEDCYDLGKRRLIPGKSLTTWGDLILTKDNRFSYVTGETTKPVTILENWSNAIRNPSYSDFSSKGQRLFIDYEKLKSFLTYINRSLILYVEVNRYSNKRTSSDGFTYYHMIYLIYPDGKIKTLDRDIEFR